MKKVLLLLSFLAFGFISNAQLTGYEYKTDSVVSVDSKEYRETLRDSFTVYFDAPKSLIITNLINNKVWHIYCTDKTFDSTLELQDKHFVRAVAFDCTVDNRQLIFTMIIDKETSIPESIGLTDESNGTLIAFFLNPKYKVIADVTKQNN